MSDILDRIIGETRERLAHSPPDTAALQRALEAAPEEPPSAWARLTAPGVHVIAEVKRRSPSAGIIRDDVDPVGMASIYEGAGASAISVLTEPEHFGGDLDDLRRIAAAVSIPTLRKDFIVADSQILEARVAGASMALLIARVLSDHELRSLTATCDRLGLLALVETHTDEEIRRAADAGARLIGVNSRDLCDFSVDLSRAERLRAAIPAGAIAVAESGIHTRDDLGRLHDAGYDVFLIGTSLMASGDPASTLRSFLARGAG